MTCQEREGQFADGQLAAQDAGRAAEVAARDFEQCKAAEAVSVFSVASDCWSGCEAAPCLCSPHYAWLLVLVNGQAAQAQAEQDRKECGVSEVRETSRAMAGEPPCEQMAVVGAEPAVAVMELGASLGSQVRSLVSSRPATREPLLFYALIVCARCPCHVSGARGSICGRSVGRSRS